MKSWEVWTGQKANRLLKKWGFPKKIVERYDELMLKAAKLCIGKTVLDVGCGFGHLLHYLPDKVEYVGLDVSSDMLAHAKKLHPNVRFISGDVYDLSTVNQYDTVYALSLLIHLPSTFESLMELWQHARKAVVFSMYLGDDRLITKPNGMIYRWESEERLRHIFNKLEIPRAETYRFNSSELDYTRLFRLRKI